MKRSSFFKTAAAVLFIAAVAFAGCRKNHVEPDEPPVTVTDEVLVQTDAEIALTADSILLTADPIQGFRTLAEQYKKLPGVQGVDVYADAMYVRYPDDIVHIWLLAPPEPAADMVAAAIKPLAAAVKQTQPDMAGKAEPKKRIGFVNVIADDGSTEACGIKDVFIPKIAEAYWAVGWDVVTPVESTYANVNFFAYRLADYNALCIFTHGCYDLSSGRTWLLTGEKPPQGTINDSKVSVLSLGDNLVKEYLAVSDEFIKEMYSNNLFAERNTVIYTNACSGMASDSLALAFVNNGAKAFYGWDAINSLGWQRSVDVMINLSKGCSIEQAITDDIRRDTEKSTDGTICNATMKFIGDGSFVMVPSVTEPPVIEPTVPAAKNTITMTTMSSDMMFDLSVQMGTAATIDWGDGTVDVKEIYSSSFCSHKYTDPGLHIITITGEGFYQLSCNDCSLTSLDVSNCTALKNLYCWGNQLTSLDITKNTALENLDCHSNKLAGLDVTKNTALKTLDCQNNQLKNLDVTKNTEMTDLDCGFNQLENLSVTNNTELTDLHCGFNQIESLDMTNNTALVKLSCYSNQLTSEGLNALFRTLHTNTMTYNNYVYVSDNPGSDSCNRTIATDKGWRVW